MRFARYLHADDQRHEIPPENAFWTPSTTQKAFLFYTRRGSAHAHCTGNWTRRDITTPPLQLRFFGLLAATGLRISEALNLRIEDG